jgi:hypothetical protein
MQPSSATTYFFKDGDSLPEIRSVLRDGAGTPVALTDSDVVTIRYRRYQSGDLATEDLATVVAPNLPATDPDAGAVAYKIPPDAAMTTGIYEVEWLVNFVSGDEATFPNEGYDVIKVGARL